MPKELQITVFMMCMEDAPATRKQNNDDLNRSREWRAQKDKVAEEKGLVDAEDEFIECIIYHRMWDSEAFWNTVTDVTTGLRRIKTKSGKIASLKDNIRVRWKGLGWEEFEKRWTVLGHELKITELANCLKELIRMQHKYKWVVPENPAVLVPQHKNIVFLGTATRQVGKLDKKSKEVEDTIEAKEILN